MFVDVAKVNDIAPGGMKYVEVNGKEIVLCNYEGTIYAVERRCGHMNAPLEKGSLRGYILTCPMHSSQFDIKSGEALSGPIPFYYVAEELPENERNYRKWIESLMSHIKVYGLKTYAVRINGDSIQVDV
ncbi:(2Fe-2S)-binding protein [Methanocella sp. CWC-04]|uniref:(2Fe-2S)-binding protein n=1 Tax=Methanooceanicella nereidis TaxID=2052831 RepID=A0AAP2R9T9_9EURY|nr:Rieske 2Fe-2S domain-containing protein [Methanocella sp. CWC-04]MCD1293551.1 (2Fe-2S)-binding protein [Methanocella sp. CWC-04]